MGEQSATTRRVFGAALLGNVAMATGPFFTQAISAPAVTTSMVRLTLGALFIAPFVRVRRSLPWRVLVPAGLMFGLGMVSFVSATPRLGLAAMFVLGATVPAWIAIAERIVFGTRLTRSALVAITVVMSGGAVAALDRLGAGSTQATGLLLYLVFISASVTDAVVVRHMSAQKSGSEYVFVVSFIAALCVLPIGVPGLAAFDPTDLACVAGWALCAGLVGRPVVAYAQRFLSATASSAIGLVAVPLAPLVAWVLYAQAPGPFTLLGGTIVVAGVLLLNRVADQTRIDHEPFDIALAEGAIEALDGSASARLPSEEHRHLSPFPETVDVVETEGA